MSISEDTFAEDENAEAALDWCRNVREYLGLKLVAAGASDPEEFKKQAQVVKSRLTQFKQTLEALEDSEGGSDRPGLVEQYKSELKDQVGRLKTAVKAQDLKSVQEQALALQRRVAELEQALREGLTGAGHPDPATAGSEAGVEPAVPPLEIDLDGDAEDIARHLSKDVDSIAKTLRASLPPEFVADAILEIAADEDEVSFNLTRGGGTLEEVTFNFKITEGGSEVYINSAFIGRELQGKGLVKELMKGLLSIAEGEPKLEKIALNANLDVGGYAWARYGFIPDDPEATVKDLTGRLSDVLTSGRFSLGGDEREVELTPDIRSAIADLQHQIAQCGNVEESQEEESYQAAFQLMSNALIKVKVPVAKLVLKASSLPGGRGWESVLHSRKMAEQNPTSIGWRLNYQEDLAALDSNLDNFLECLDSILDKNKVPGTDYVPDSDGVTATREAIARLRSGGETAEEKAPYVNGFRLSVTAPETEVALSALFMLGAGWEGQMGIGKNAGKGLDRLKGYVG